MTTWTPEEYAYIEQVLRGAYLIRTAEGEEDELLGDFIQALADGESISMEG